MKNTKNNMCAYTKIDSNQVNDAFRKIFIYLLVLAPQKVVTLQRQRKNDSSKEYSEDYS